MSSKQRNIGLLKITFQELEKALGIDEKAEIIDVLCGERERKTNVLLAKIKSPKCKLIVLESYEIPIYPIADIRE